MSTKEASTDWTKLTVAQLKGALARRGLSSDGGKEELVKRLKEADDAEDFQNMAVDGEEESEEKPPMLFTADFKHYVGFMMSLKTVIINPFKLDMMQDPSFVAWLDDCLSYSIRKNGAGVSAVQLFFDSIEKGDAALADLKANLKDEELDIYHPRKFMKSKHAAIQIPEDFEELVDDKSADNLWRRLLLLENLPAKLNTEEKLSEFFPEAMQAISFNFVPASQGIAVLEFSTTKEAYDYKNSVGDEIKLEDQDIKVSKYLDRSHEWASANNLWMKAHKDKTPDLGSDEERLALINDLDQVTTEMEKFHQSDECFGQDKMAKFAQFEQKIKELRRRLHKDTKQRVSKGDLEMPEGENSLPFLHFLDEKKKPSEQTPEQNWEKLFQTDSKIHAVETELKSLNFAMSKLQEQLTKEQKEEWVEIQKQSINPKNKKVQGQYNRGKRGGFSGRGRGNTQQGRGGMQQARGGGNQGKGEGNKGRGGLQQGRGGGNRGRGGGNRGRGGGNQGRGGFQQGGQKKNQKRPGSMQSSYDMDEPPSKKQQINYGFRKNKNYKGGMQDYQGGNQNEGGQGNMALIEGITSALTDKMLQLENLQKQTLKTQAALLDNKPTSYSSGGGNKSYRGGYRGGSKSYSKGNRYGSSSRGGYSNSTGSGTNYGSSSRGGFSNSSGYGDSYGSSSRGGYSNTSGNDIYGSSSRGGYSNSSGNGDSYGSSSRGGYSNTSGNGDSYGSSSRDGYSNSTYQY